MKHSVVYLLGLFDNKNNSLFLDTKFFLKRYGYTTYGIEIYPKKSFGSYSFKKELKRINREIKKHNPDLIIAHSLGAYISTQFKISCPCIFLDPSLEISKIVKSNLKQTQRQYWYNDGTNHFLLSREFLSSVTKTPLVESIKFSNSVYIFGAGRGAGKMAEKYHKYIQHSYYKLLPRATHDFLRKEDRKKIYIVIKNGLGLSSATK